MSRPEENERPVANPEGLLAKLNAVRGTGLSNDELITVVLDGTSDLIDLSLDSKVMRLPSEDIAAGIKQAFAKAREAVQVETKAASADALKPLSTEAMARLTQVSEESLKRLSDLAGIAQSISDRMNGGQP